MIEKKRSGTETGIPKTPHEKPSGMKNHFERLPQELLVSILTAIADLKSLCRCSVASKHFGSAVFRVRVVYVDILRSQPRFSLCAMTAQKDPELKPLEFLAKFSKIESILLEYKYPKISSISTFLKWKVKFSSNFPKIERFVVMFPKQFKRLTEQREFAWNSAVLSQAQETCVEWLGVVSMLAKSHMSLKRVVITDSEKRGKMFIGYEQLVKLRDCPPEALEWPKRTGGLNVCVPVMHLPLSGYAMKEVHIRIYNCKSRSSDTDEILSWDFEDEEKVLGEGIEEIFQNHRHKFNKLTVLYNEHFSTSVEISMESGELKVDK